MENENVGEQPIFENEQESVQENGSPFGKFANAQELKNAYENLEKEFTRKSQLLKTLQEKANEKTQFLDNATNGNENSQLPTAEDTSFEVADEKTDKTAQDVPYWEKEDWESQVQDFLKQNPLAKNYAQQISETLLKDKDLLLSKTPLQSAWAKWLEENYKTPEQLFDDEDFLSKAKQNERLRREIIKDYVYEINHQQKSPPLFAVSQGGVTHESLENFPKTLEEAKELAKKIFSN